MTVIALAAALSEMASGYVPPRDRRVAAQAIIHEAKDFDPVLLGALALHESSLKRNAKGKRHETGLFQILPATARHWCRRLVPRLHWARPNARCAVRILRRARDRCGPNPLLFLSAYNGHSCVVSKYSRRVVRLYRRAGP